MPEIIIKNPKQILPFSLDDGIKPLNNQGVRGKNHDKSEKPKST